MAYLSFLAAILLGVPAANAFAISARTSTTRMSAGGSVQRADFLKQVGGAAALATAGIAAAPLASVAASSECTLQAGSLSDLLILRQAVADELTQFQQLRRMHGSCVHVRMFAFPEAHTVCVLKCASPESQERIADF